MMPDAADNRALKSEEERPADAPAAREKCGGMEESTESGFRGSCDADRGHRGDGRSVRGAHSPARSEEAVISVASLFGDGVDRGKNEDY